MSAARDREHDEWIPWYVEDTPGWLELSLAARGAMEGIARKLNKKTGKLHLRRGLSSLALLLHCRWEELEPALAELIVKGKVTWDGSAFVLADPEYIERKRRSGADRMADSRANRKRDASDVADVAPAASPPSQASRVTDVTDVLISSDLLSSGSGSQIASPPEWWGVVCDQVDQNHGVTLNRGGAWLGYWGHRTDKGRPVNQADALSWLTRVDVPALRKEREDARHRADRDKAFDAKRRFAKDGPEKPPPPTKAQSEAFANELAARLTASRKVGT